MISPFKQAELAQQAFQRQLNYAIKDFDFILKTSAHTTNAEITILIAKLQEKFKEIQHLETIRDYYNGEVERWTKQN